MLESLEKLASLPEATEVYCTHEYTQANLRFALACDPDNANLVKRAAQVNELRADQRITLPSTIGLELKTNPFLRCDQTSLLASAEKFLGKAPSGKTQTFAAIRAWKDEF
jgi:hydroxyacylglutathione hydrolase